MTFSKRLGIECANYFRVSKITLFHAKRSRLFSSWSLYIVATGIKMRRVHWSVILVYKVWRILLTPCQCCLWSVCRCSILDKSPLFIWAKNSSSLSSLSGHLTPDVLMLTVSHFYQGFDWCSTQKIRFGLWVAWVTLWAHDPSCHPTLSDFRILPHLVIWSNTKVLRAPYDIVFFFFGLGYWKKYLGHSSVNNKLFQSSAISFAHFLANLKRAFLRRFRSTKVFWFAWKPSILS